MPDFLQRRIPSAILFFLLFFSFQSYAQKTWTGGGGDGKWETAANWNGNTVPTTTQTVTIGNGFAVTVNSAITCAGITMSAGGTVSSLTIAGSSSLTVNGTVTITGANTANRTISVGAGTLTATAISVGAAGAGRQNAITMTTGLMDINGNITLSGAGTLSSLTISGTGRLRITGGITGAGLLSLSSNSITELDGDTQTLPFATTGFDGTYGDILISSTTGTAVRVTDAVTGTSLKIQGNATASILTVNNGASLTLSGDITLATGTGNGDHGRLNVNAGSVTCSGITMGDTPNNNRKCIVNITTGTLTVNGSITTLGAALENTITITTTGRINITGDITGDGTLDVSTSSTVNLNGTSVQQAPFSSNNFSGVYGRLIIDNTAGVELNDPITVSNLIVNANRTLTLIDAGTLTVVDGGATNDVEVSGTVISGVSAAIAVPTGAIFNVLSGGTLDMGLATMTGAGTFTLSGGASFITANAGGLASSGATGAIRTTTRNYSSSSNYDFRGAITGLFTTAPTALTVNDLSINSTGTTLSQNETVNGTLTLENGVLSIGTNTLTLPGTVTQNNGGITSSAAGTVNYSRASAGQNVASGTYGILTFSNFNKVLPQSTVNIAGTFTTGTATGHTITGNTINFNGANGQTIPAFNYNNLSSSNNTRILQGSGTIGIAGNFTPGTSAYTTTGSTVNFNGTTDQDVAAINGNYNNFTVSGANATRLLASATVNGTLTLTAGTLDVGTNTLTINGAATQTSGVFASQPTGTVAYNKSSNVQNVLIGSYGNLTFSNFTKTLPSAETVNIAGTFTPGNASGHTITGSTVNYNGADGQSIALFPYNNLSSTNNTRTLPPAGTLTIAGVFTPGTSAYTATGSTVSFNGSGAQNIPAIAGGYNNVMTATGGTKTLTGSTSVGGAVTVGPSTTLNLGSATLTLTGGGSPLVVNGTLTPASSTVIFNSASDQVVPESASIGYHLLTLTGAGTKAITAATPTEFNVDLNLNISSPVTYTNISSIFIFKEFNGNMPLASGSIPVTVGDDWKNTATGYTLTGEVSYTALDGTTLEIGGINYTNLRIVKSAGHPAPVTQIANPITVAGLLTIGDGVTFATGGKVTLLSTASANANVAQLTGTANISGNLKVQEFLTGGVDKRGTRIISSPVSETVALRNAGRSIYQQLKENVVVTGPGGATNGFDPGNNNQPYAVTLTKYNETANATQSQFITIPDLLTGTVMNYSPGDAFFLFFRGDRSNYDPENPGNSTKLDSYTIPESFPTLFEGTANQGNISVNITRTNTGDANYDGYNVIGNPYPATIDWESVYSANSTMVENEIRFIKPGGGMLTRSRADGDPDPIVVGGAALNSQYIQTGQGFYIRKKNDGAGTLNFTEANKAVAATPNRLLYEPNQKNLFSSLSMSLAGAAAVPAANGRIVLYFNIKDDKNTDEAAIVFKQGGNAMFDRSDAIFLTGSTVSLSSLTADGKLTAINRMPALSEVSEIKINVNASLSGPVTLNFTSLAALGGSKVTLKDNFLNTLTDLKANPSYAFSIDRSNPGTFGAGRFVLLFEAAPEPAVVISAFTAVQQQTGVALNWATSSERESVRFEVERSADGVNFTKIGEAAAAGNSTTDVAYNYNDNMPLSGTNTYRLKQVFVDGTYAYSETRSVVYTKPTGNGPGVKIKLYPNPVIDVVHITAPGISTKVTIYDLFGRVVKTGVFTAEAPIELNISMVRTGIYFAEIKNNQTGKTLDVKIFLKK